MEHVSVLKNEVLEYLDLSGDEIVVDGTLGLGGHSLEIVKLLRKGKLIAFEQDERNLREAKKRLEKYIDRIIFVHDNFCFLKNRVIEAGFESVDRIFFDLGLSSPHVDEAERGFSFMREGPLDMRFDPRRKLTAADVVNNYAEEDLAKIFYEYGEERLGNKIARKIVERRKEKAFERTTELADFVQDFYPKKRSSSRSKSHPATRIFQALRIEVNDELEVLKKTLEQSFEILSPGGLILVITYHSLEDRIVKRYFKDLEQPPVTDPQEAIYRNFGDPLVEKVVRKPILPSKEEVSNNPRARSAKLRIYKKI